MTVVYDRYVADEGIYFEDVEIKWMNKQAQQFIIKNLWKYVCKNLETNLYDFLHFTPEALRKLTRTEALNIIEERYRIDHEL